MRARRCPAGATGGSRLPAWPSGLAQEQGSMGLLPLGTLLVFLILGVLFWDLFLIHVGRQQAQTAADAAAAAVATGISLWVDEAALPEARATMTNRVREVRELANQAGSDYLRDWLAAHPPPAATASPAERAAWQQAWAVASREAEAVAEAARREAVGRLFPGPELLCTRAVALAGRVEPPPGERYWLLTPEQQQRAVARAVGARGAGPLRELAHQWAVRNGAAVQVPVRMRGDRSLEVTAHRPLRFPLFRAALDGLSVPSRALVTPDLQPDHRWCQGNPGG